MCSSPKSSGSAPKIRVKGFFEEMAPQQRNRFTEVANRADERRAVRNKTNKRWEAKQEALAPSRGIFSWLAKLITSN
ncbi:MAG: hypothetical protein ACI88A_002344 [Paraglaciecola sp.]|jgi:hypothetical protein